VNCPVADARLTATVPSKRGFPDIDSGGSSEHSLFAPRWGIPGARCGIPGILAANRIRSGSPLFFRADLLLCEAVFRRILAESTRTAVWLAAAPFGPSQLEDLRSSHAPAGRRRTSGAPAPLL